MFQSRQGNVNMHSGTWNPQNYKSPRDSLLRLSKWQEEREDPDADTDGRGDSAIYIKH